MKELFLGIDGGGTKTAVCIIDKDMNIIGQAVSGPSSYDTVSVDEIKKNISNAISQIKFDGEIKSVFAGLGGIAKKEDSLVVKGILSEFTELSNALIEVDNDVLNAYYSALGDENGIVVIIGTGTVAYGVNNGKTHRCGGYCYQEGDAGSSYDLGRKALQYYARVIDKRYGESEFSNAIKEKIKVDNFGDLAHYLVNATRTEIASLAKVVTQNSDNEFAKKIINCAVFEVLAMIDTVYRELEFKNTKIAIVGSLGNADTLYKELLLNDLEKRKIKFIPLRYEAYLGSCVKALVNYERRK